MTKGVGLLVLTAALLLGLPAYAGNPDEAPKRLLSFSFNPREFFQVGPAPMEKGAEPLPGTGEDAGAPEREEARDARAYVNFALYGLFRFDSTEGYPDTFDMPGAYIRGEGEWENYKISIMTNAAIAESLTWAYIGAAPWMNHKEKLMLRFGLFAVPFGMQMQTMPFDLSSIEYSLIVRDITDIVAIYDMGVMAHGRFKIRDGGISYALSVLNGEYTRNADTNEAKTFAGRLGFQFTPYIEIGGSYYSGKTTDRTDVNWPFDVRHERTGVDLKWLPGNFKIRGEYINATEDPESHYYGIPSVWDRGVSQRTEGWWIDAGMFLWVSEETSDEFEKRGFELYGHYQGFAPPPDEIMRTYTGHSCRTQFVYGLGVNLDLSKNVKLRFLWQHLDLGRYHLGKYQGYDPGKRNDKILVQLAIAVF